MKVAFPESDSASFHYGSHASYVVRRREQGSEWRRRRRKEEEGGGGGGRCLDYNLIGIAK